MLARHTYEDWCKDCTSNEVGIIISGDIKKGFLVKYHDIKVAVRQGVDDFDLITEHEYYKIVDPVRCGPDIPIPTRQECLFTGKMVLMPPMPVVFEDLFAC